MNYYRYNRRFRGKWQVYNILMRKVKTGEVFKAHNKYMTPPKESDRIPIHTEKYRKRLEELGHL